MGFDKLAAPLCGSSVLRRTIDALAACPDISEIVLVCPLERWQALGSPAPGGVTFRRIDGGAERQDSVACGLAVVTADFVCVHDGARPLVAVDDVQRCIHAAFAVGAAALARRVADTLRRGGRDDLAAETVERANLWAMETPQCARTSVLREALADAQAHQSTVTDETTALTRIGIGVKLVESRHPNPKITTPADLALAEALLL